MDLESEPVTVSGDWAKRAATLLRHGATDDEIAFLRNRRVELNAMWGVFRPDRQKWIDDGTPIKGPSS
jgi:hypothetical protein